MPIERRPTMTGNALKNTDQFEPDPRQAADKLLVTRRLTLSQWRHAAISPKNNRPSRYETKPGSSFR